MRSTAVLHELLKSSTMTTRYPQFSSSTQVWLPIKPAPPVKRTVVLWGDFARLLFDMNGILTVFFARGRETIIRRARRLTCANNTRAKAFFVLLLYSTSKLEGRFFFWRTGGVGNECERWRRWWRAMRAAGDDRTEVGAIAARGAGTREREGACLRMRERAARSAATCGNAGTGAGSAQARRR